MLDSRLASEFAGQQNHGYDEYEQVDGDFKVQIVVCLKADSHEFGTASLLSPTLGPR